MPFHCLAWILVAALIATGCAPWPVRQQHLDRARFQFALIGDSPYSERDAEVGFPNLMRDLNSHRLAFVVHDGDIKGGSVPCDDAILVRRLALFQTSRHPFIFIPGDNEWSDCANGRTEDDRPAPFDPSERLERLRALFCADDFSLGQRRLRLERPDPESAHAAFRENVRWFYGGVCFVGLNIVGTNNHHGYEEFAGRNRANLAWMREAFALARTRHARAVMVLIQANPKFDLKKGDPARAGFEDFLAALEEETMRFGRPVVLVHGDSHYFRIDKPMIHARSGRRVEHFTRVETFGNPDMHWIRASVDWRDPNVFTFQQRIVTANLVAHE